MVVNPAKFLRDVRIEVSKVSWPTRRETMITTGLVLGMAAICALFFFAIDQAVGVGVRALFGASA